MWNVIREELNWKEAKKVLGNGGYVRRLHWITRTEDDLYAPTALEMGLNELQVVLRPSIKKLIIPGEQPPLQGTRVLHKFTDSQESRDAETWLEVEWSEI